jgi:hypothetical protein
MMFCKRENPKIIKSQIINYLVRPKQECKLAYQTRWSYMSALTTFYMLNDVNFNKKMADI